MLCTKKLAMFKSLFSNENWHTEVKGGNVIFKILKLLARKVHKRYRMLCYLCLEAETSLGLERDITVYSGMHWDSKGAVI